MYPRRKECGKTLMGTLQGYCFKHIHKNKQTNAVANSTGRIEIWKKNPQHSNKNTNILEMKLSEISLFSLQ